MNDKIVIKGAKEHNLKNINLEIPRDKLVVITGLSGSGKSSLAFDTLYAEGQRRYVESLSSYARQFLGLMEKPDVESIEGLSPAISIDQKTTSKNPRSTVGTVTEIYDYIRLLYARVGVPHCPHCGKKIEKQSIDQIIDKASQLHMSTNKDNIEFIICTADKNDNTTITCIKEHNILSNCTSAWIGSYTAFRKLQEIRTDSFTSSYTFRRAVSECSDDSVGGLIIQNTYRQEEHRFVYPEGYYSSYERKQTIKPGENVILSGPAETGAFTTYYHDSTDEVIIDFWQNNTSVIYSTKYRYGSTDVNNSNTKYFLLPAIYNTETGKFI